MTEYDKLSEEEKAARDAEIAIVRRQAELRVKNPETAIWQKYSKKVQEENQVMSIAEEEVEVAPTDAQILSKAFLSATASQAKPGAPNNPDTPTKPVNNYITPSAIVEKKVIKNAYLDDKIKHTVQERVYRAESRAERKQKRDQDPDLKQKTRTTVSGAEY